MKNTIDIFLMW